MGGFIKLHREIMNWEWYKDIPVRVLFEHCLLSANHEDAKWRGIVIKRGSFITSRAKLARETGLTEMQVRTALKKLNSTSEITSETTSEYSIIIINNWDLYQLNNQVNNQRITSEQPANNQRITTNKNEKNEENEENIERDARARDKRYIENSLIEDDPYLSKNVQTFLETYKKETHRSCRLAPDERLKLFSILNDLIMQGLNVEEASRTVCANFLNMNARNNFGINWLLKDNNFYAILNGEWQKKELPKDSADTGGEAERFAKIDRQIDEYFRKKAEKERERELNRICEKDIEALSAGGSG